MGAAEGFGAVADKHQRLHESLERMFAHLRANEVDIDKPAITAGVWLEMDPASERFVGNDGANKLLTREYRAGYVVPDASA